jgi:hypothetical protein
MNMKQRICASALILTLCAVIASGWTSVALAGEVVKKLSVETLLGSLSRWDGLLFMEEQGALLFLTGRVLNTELVVEGRRLPIAEIAAVRIASVGKEKQAQVRFRDPTRGDLFGRLETEIRLTASFDSQVVSVQPPRLLFLVFQGQRERLERSDWEEELRGHIRIILEESDTIVLLERGIANGTIQNRTFPLATSQERKEIPKGDIQAIFVGKGGELDRVLLRTGSELVGQLLIQQVQFNWRGGQMAMAVNDIAIIAMNSLPKGTGGDSGEKIKP